MQLQNQSGTGGWEPPKVPGSWAGAFILLFFFNSESAYFCCSHPAVVTRWFGISSWLEMVFIYLFSLFIRSICCAAYFILRFTDCSPRNKFKAKKQADWFLSQSPGWGSTEGILGNSQRSWVSQALPADRWLCLKRLSLGEAELCTLKGSFPTSQRILGLTLHSWTCLLALGH